MKFARAFLVGLVLGLGATIATGSEDLDQKSMVMRWTAKRDRCVVQLIGRWLRGASQEDLRGLTREIIRLESLKGTCSTAANDLYLSSLEPKDFHNVAPRILEIYLSRQGIRLKSADFFEGKTFKLLVKTQPVAPQSQAERSDGRDTTGKSETSNSGRATEDEDETKQGSTER